MGHKFNAHGGKACANFAGAEQRQSMLTSLLQKFGPKDIYNSDKTDLFYRATQHGSLVYKHEALPDSKKAMDRVTVLYCSNMLRIDKRKLLVIGK